MPPGEKLSIAAIVSDQTGPLEPGLLESLANGLAEDWELVIVAHHLDPGDVRTLSRSIKQIPDATLHILDSPASDDIARLAALDVAIGDRILIIDPSRADGPSCSLLLEQAQRGFEVVIATPAQPASNRFMYRALRRVFLGFYRWISGVRIEKENPVAWLYSRAAGLHLLSRRESEMLLKSTGLGPAFPGTAVRWPQAQRKHRRRRTNALARAYRALNLTSSVPLRSVVVLCLLSAIANLAYMVYTVASRFLYGGITPGWTSLSLQISGIFLILSIILAIIAEHLIEIDRAINKRPRYRILREIRSPLSRVHSHRNVVGAI